MSKPVVIQVFKLRGNNSFSAFALGNHLVVLVAVFHVVNEDGGAGIRSLWQCYRCGLTTLVIRSNLRCGGSYFFTHVVFVFKSESGSSRSLAGAFCLMFQLQILSFRLERLC